MQIALYVVCLRMMHWLITFLSEKSKVFRKFFRLWKFLGNLGDLGNFLDFKTNHTVALRMFGF